MDTALNNLLWVRSSWCWTRPPGIPLVFNYSTSFLDFLLDNFLASDIVPLFSQKKYIMKNFINNFFSGPTLFLLSMVKYIAIKDNYKIVTCFIISNIYN